LKDLTLLNRNEKRYPNNPADAKLEAFRNRFAHRDYEITFHCPEFTALCPVTGQPDFGEITIHYIPDQLCIESKALKLYLFAYRNHPTFHEEAVNRILEDIVAACHPRWCLVHGKFRPRGGISLEVKAEHKTEQPPPAKHE
ncbi:MAG: NADPH-dependent 7-cyano-7-deazaguanine reductase QueF, partial [Lentisphaerae bacterium]